MSVHARMMVALAVSMTLATTATATATEPHGLSLGPSLNPSGVLEPGAVVAAGASVRLADGMPDVRVSRSVDPSATVGVAFARFSRVAIWSDGSDSMTLSVRVTGAVSSVEASDMGYDVLEVGSEVGQFALYDDGTHGDTTPDDSVYSRSDIRGASSSSMFSSIQIILTDHDGGSTTVYANDANFYLVDPSLRTPVHRVSAGVSYASRVINLKVGAHVLPIANTYVDMEPPDLQRVTRLLYHDFPDRYDFVSVFSSLAFPYNFHESVQNHVRGIGSSTFDATPDYGSAGRLLGVNFLSGAGALTHETLHQWGIFLDSPLCQAPVRRPACADY